MKKYLVIAAAIAVALLAYRTFKKPEIVPEVERTAARNLVLISIDTIRADDLQIYKPDGAPTPNLAKIAANGFLFENVIAQVPFTLPSHSTMLTGTYPAKHKVNDNIAAKLGDDAVTLAEVMKSRGYQTAGFVGALVLESGTGIEQGFETFDDAFVREDMISDDRSGTQKTAAAVKRSFVNWLDQRKTDSPFFSFIHFYDPHAPYDPPAGFRPATKEPRALYRGELQYVDSVIGELIEELTRRQLLDQTMLVITGDHGEMFGEHGENGHGFFIYQEAVHVPLLISLPHQAGGKSEEVLELVDLMPTILELLQIPVPETVQGKSFAKSLNGTKSNSGPAYSESLTASQHFGAAPLRSIQDARYKYIDSPRPELYDLRADAQELDNLVDQQKEIAAKMKSSLDSILTRNTDTQSKMVERELTPEQQEQFAALGYIGGTSNMDFSDSSLDPKDCLQSWADLGRLGELVKQPHCRECISIIERMQKRGVLPVQARIFAARAYSGLGNYPKSISMLQGIVEENPKNVQAQIALAYSHQKAGDSPSALRIYKQLMEEDSIVGLEKFAELMIRLNRQEELQRTIEQYVSRKTISDKHYPVLGEIYLLIKQPEQAKMFLMRAMETAPDNPYVYIHLSALTDAQGRTIEAIQLLEQNRHRFATADYLMQLGKLYAKTGNVRMEHQTFQKMVQSYPNDPRGYFFLGKIILQQRGDAQQVIDLAEKGLSLNPDAEMRPFGFFLLGDAHDALGRTDKAQSYLKQAEELRKGATNIQ